MPCCRCPFFFFLKILFLFSLRFLFPPPSPLHSGSLFFFFHGYNPLGVTLPPPPPPLKKLCFLRDLPFPSRTPLSADFSENPFFSPNPHLFFYSKHRLFFLSPQGEEFPLWGLVGERARLQTSPPPPSPGKISCVPFPRDFSFESTLPPENDLTQNILFLSNVFYPPKEAISQFSSLAPRSEITLFSARAPLSPSI